MLQLQSILIRAHAEIHFLSDWHSRAQWAAVLGACMGRCGLSGQHPYQWSKCIRHDQYQRGEGTQNLRACLGVRQSLCVTAIALRLASCLPQACRLAAQMKEVEDWLVVCRLC